MVESIELRDSGYKISLTDDILSIFLINGTTHSYVNSADVMLAMFNRIKKLEKSIEEFEYDIEHGLAR